VSLPHIFSVYSSIDVSKRYTCSSICNFDWCCSGTVLNHIFKRNYSIYLALQISILILCSLLFCVPFPDYDTITKCRAGLLSDSQRIKYTIDTFTKGIPDARTYLNTLQEIRIKYILYHCYTIFLFMIP
jgi:hypothetical protein